MKHTVSQPQLQQWNLSAEELEAKWLYKKLEEMKKKNERLEKERSKLI